MKGIALTLTSALSRFSSPKRPRAAASGRSMTSQASSLHQEGPARLAVGQMCSGFDVLENFQKVRRLAESAKRQRCSALALPECFSFMGSSQADALATAEDLSGPKMQRYRDLAKETGLWLSLGGFQEKGPDDSHLFNCHVVIDASGECVACYRKIHLFSYQDEENDIRLEESAFTVAGTQVVCCDSVVGRFPLLYQTLRFDHGAEILLVPSAFTVPTGKAHWEPLLKARAIETQCYVIAAAQTNRHNHKRESYGHTMAIDPWGANIHLWTLFSRVNAGEVLFDLGTQEDEMGVVEIDLEKLRRLRESMPLDRHRSAFLHCLSEQRDGTPGTVSQGACQVDGHSLGRSPETLMHGVSNKHGKEDASSKGWRNECQAKDGDDHI